MKKLSITFSLIFMCLGCLANNEITSNTLPLVSDKNKEQLETAIIGGGCFWCTEAVFEKVDGVKEAISGYAGGKNPNPTYKEICTGLTGHAEVIKILFDPAKISFREILEIFGDAHDPTTLNRQGADVGTQYRSTIMYLNESQKQTAEKWKIQLNAKLQDPVVTEIVPAPKFYEAEKYHQDYYEKNPNQGYCNFVIRPKLKKLNLE
ncbi:MAG: peptide-methionine (S)-S-oxide reductase MsrA [Opitutales bacterium]|nr:peptide-methionine (S)-S-oxide reductase MsrA [Opitutales bacterium]